MRSNSLNWDPRPSKDGEGDIVDFETIQRWRHGYQAIHGRLRGAKRDAAPLSRDDMTLCENIARFPPVAEADPDAKDVSFTIAQLREWILGGTMWSDLSDVERLENLHRCMAHLKPFGILKYDPVNPQEIVFHPSAYRKVVDLGLEPGGFFEEVTGKLTGR